MKARLQLSLVVGFLILTGIGLTLYKHLALGFPLLRADNSLVWSVEGRVDFDATGKETQVSLSLPDQQSGVRILDESFASPGYGITQLKKNDQRRALWSIREASGPQELFYKVQLHLDPSATSSPEDKPEIPTEKPTLTEPYQTAAKALIDQAHQQSSDEITFTSLLIRAIASPKANQNASMLLGGLNNHTKKVPLLIDLLHMADIPSRIVRGVNLEDGRRRQPVVDMLEVYTKKGWVLFNPTTGQPGTPDNFFLWQRGGKSLLDVVGGKNSRVSFSVISQYVPTRGLALKTSRMDDVGLIDFSIYSLPLESQTAFKTILLIPIGTLVVLIMRILVGLKTSGTFMPVLIAVAFLHTQLLPGLTIFITIVGIGLWLRSILSQLNMLLVARLAAIIIVVIGIMAAMSILSWKLGMSEAMTITFFPMIILAWTIERMSILWEESGPKDVFKECGGSLLVASISYLVITNPTIEHMAFNFPELLLSVLGITLMLGQYSGYRLLELRRFRPVASGK
ncbi:hypothetical protein CI610_00812 [invertebrate metagenome]|uniref:7 transmembrane helices usually fused to an inactive transglutaminase domain-containing protein n=1 Tax=invertebrate metagenome TaxID=1711999 RepID=A0A2H9TAI7_9ZZZZ